MYDGKQKLKLLKIRFSMPMILHLSAMLRSELRVLMMLRRKKMMMAKHEMIRRERTGSGVRRVECSHSRI